MFYYYYKMSDTSISTIQTILGLVKVIEKKDLNGSEKRDELCNTLKSLMGEDTFLKNKDNIDYVLETIIFISKIHKIAGINQDTFSYCCKPPHK